KQAKRALGYDENQSRERDLRILRVATIANLFARGINVTERPHSNRMTVCVGLARILSIKFNCRVFDASKHLDPRDRSHRAAILCWPTAEQWATACLDDDRQWQIRSLLE